MVEGEQNPGDSHPGTQQREHERLDPLTASSSTLVRRREPLYLDEQIRDLIITFHVIVMSTLQCGVERLPRKTDPNSGLHALNPTYEILVRYPNFVF